jgi:thiol-disulfide isomerase/thioredoxin
MVPIAAESVSVLSCQDQQCIVDKTRMPAEANRLSDTTDDNTRNPISDKLTMQISELYQIPLNLINCSFGIVRKDPQVSSLQSVIKHQRKVTGADVTVLFAIRTPGCGLCREHGIQLSEWAAKYVNLSKKHPSVTLMGVVKESGSAATDEALLNFYQGYFRHPIYQDSKWEIYHALGGRKISVWNVLSSVRALQKRWASKNIVNQPQGEVWMQGGVLVFDKRGELRHVMYEKFGEMFDTDALDVVIHKIKRQYKASSAESHGSKETTHSDTSSSEFDAL